MHNFAQYRTSFGLLTQWPAASMAESIHAFVAAGGRFDSSLNHHGRTAASIAAENLDALHAYIAVDGPFSDDPDNRGITTAMYVAQSGADAIRAYCDAGGTFTDQRDDNGLTALTYAYLGGDEAMLAYRVAVIAQGGLRIIPTRRSVSERALKARPNPS